MVDFAKSGHIFNNIPGICSFLSARTRSKSSLGCSGKLAGKANQNLTVSEFIKNTEVLSSIWIDNIVGNCRG